MPKKSEEKKLKEWYKKELERRDKQIDDLKAENLRLMKLALKQSEKTMEMEEKLNKKVKADSKKEYKGNDE